MHRFEAVQELTGTPADFWSVLLDMDYVREFNAAAGIEVELLRLERQGPRVERDVRYRSSQPVPVVLRPFMPDGIGYVEYGVLDEAAQRYEHRLQPMPLGARAELRATITVEVVAPERFRRIYAGAFEVRVPLIGARLERDAARAMMNENPESAALTQRWVEQRAEQRRAAAR